MLKETFKTIKDIFVASLEIVAHCSLPLLVFALFSSTAVKAQSATLATDIQMPKLSGEQAIEYLKQSGSFDALNAVYQSANSDQTQLATQPTTLIQQAKLLAADGTSDDRFSEVAISGNRAIVGAFTQKIGANTDQGAAYVFVRDGATWTQEAKLVASDGGAGDYFGWEVGIKGNYALVTAQLDDVGNNIDQGSAYIFVNVNGSWVQQAKLVAGDGKAGDEFGRGGAVFVDNGNTYFAVGAWGADISTSTNQGAVYIFGFQDVSYVELAKLSIANPTPSASLGYSVAHDGNTLVVSAAGENLAQGAVYVFTGSGASWTQQARLTASDGVANDWFGWNIAIDGDRIVASAKLHDINGQINQGAAYVFVRSGSSWVQQTKLVAADGNANDSFGQSVAIQGNKIFVGAYSDEVNFRDQGSVYMYGFVNGAWVQRYKMFATDGARSDLFGYSVAVSGDTLIVGAVDHNERRGAAYIFPASPERSDFDGDGKADVSVFRPSNGTWYGLKSATNNSLFSAQFGQAGDKIVPADYDGDGKTDIALYRPSTGVWYWINSSNNAFNAAQWGTSEDIPVPAYFRDGDFRADLTVFRPSTGTWYINRSNGGTLAIQWGQSGDIPVPADYQGDGLDNIAVFRPSNGTWYIRNANATLTAIAHGQASDVPTPIDYDGDGKTDVGVFRPSEGVWYWINSSSNIYRSRYWGQAGDIPAVADYDGDGYANFAVFRPSNGTWYIRNADGTLNATQFGLSGDRPISAAFAP